MGSGMGSAADGLATGRLVVLSFVEFVSYGNV